MLVRSIWFTRTHYSSKSWFRCVLRPLGLGDLSCVDRTGAGLRGTAGPDPCGCAGGGAGGPLRGARRGAACTVHGYAHSGRGSQYEPRQGVHLLGAHRGCEGALLAVDDHALDKLDARRVDAVPLVRVRRVLAEEDMAEVAAARVAGELDAAHLRTHTHATTGLNVELPSWGCLAQGLWRGREA